MRQVDTASCESGSSVFSITLSIKALEQRDVERTKSFLRFSSAVFFQSSRSFSLFLGPNRIPELFPFRALIRSYTDV
jgi:hypothetical protein